MNDNMDEEQNNKLNDLKQKISAVRKAETEKKTGPSKYNNDMSEMARGLRVGWEFILSVLLGAAAGYGLDQWLGTAPLCLITLLFLGMGVGFVNVYRITNNIGYTIGYSALHKPEKKDKQSIDN